MNKSMRRGAEHETASRTLIYIPIIHTQADMGGLSQSVRQATLQKLGRTGWKHKVSVVDRLWTRIEQVLGTLIVSYEDVRLYQDGLPVCGREAELVKEMATGGSRNHQMLFRLMEKGATVMGTESPELLVEEYEKLKETLMAKNTTGAVKNKTYMKALSESLLRRRDQFIANRINNTLRGGETGILFLGMFHSLANRLDKDIRVTYPVNRPLGR